jgi:protein-S-isoprenylcysteine O-methyltransferase Ste14
MPTAAVAVASFPGRRAIVVVLNALLGLPAFVAYITRFQIRPEEQALKARFGSDYDDYRARVRRWL